MSRKIHNERTTGIILFLAAKRTRGAVGEDGDVDALQELGYVRLGGAFIHLRLPRLWRKYRVEGVLVRGSLRRGRGEGGGSRISEDVTSVPNRQPSSMYNSAAVVQLL